MSVKSWFIQPEKRATAFLAAIVFMLPVANNVVLSLLLLLWLIHSFSCIKKTGWAFAFTSPITWASIAFYGIYAISFLYSTDVETGLRGLETKLSFVILPVILLAHKDFINRQKLMLLLKSFVLGNVFTGFLAFGLAGIMAIQNQSWFYITEYGHSTSYFTYEFLAMPFMHPGYLATYMGVALLGALFLYSLFNNWLWIIAAIFLFFCMFMLQGRINILALFVVLGAATMVMAIKDKAYKWLLAMVAAVGVMALLLVFAPASLKARYLQMPNFSYDISGEKFTSATYRLAEWRCAKDAIAQKPIFGYGIGDFKQGLLDAYEKNKFYNGLQEKFNAHNQFLETTLAVGFVGLACMLWLFVVYYYQAYRQKNHLQMAALTFFIICLLTESMFERAWAVILFNTYFPLASLWRNLPEPQKTTRT